MPKPLPNLTGKRFGRWLVLGLAPNRGSKRRWFCVCDCGTKRDVFDWTLKKGESTSCGCYAIEQSKKRGFPVIIIDGVTYKTCQKCKKLKQLQYFNTSVGQIAGRASICKDCCSIKSLKQYGITEHQYNSMLEDQGNRCAICGSCSPGSSGRWRVDHNHGCCPGEKSCGNCVRGLLCRTCNSGLGFLHDDSILLRRAADYVEKICPVY